MVKASPIALDIMLKMIACKRNSSLPVKKNIEKIKAGIPKINTPNITLKNDHINKNNSKLHICF